MPTKLFFRDEAPQVAGPPNKLTAYPDTPHWTNFNNPGRRMKTGMPEYAPAIWQSADDGEVWVNVATESENDIYFGAFVSDPLSAQTIEAGDWTLAIGAYLEDSSAGADPFVDIVGRPGIYTYRPSTGLSDTTIDASGFYSGTVILDSNTGIGKGTSHVINKAPIIVQKGDLIVVEMWIMAEAMIGSSGNKDCAVKMFFGGTTEPVDGEDCGEGDEVASYLNVPGTLVFQPYGELLPRRRTRSALQRRSR